MGKPVIGEVVVLPFPQTDLQAGKRRPALAGKVHDSKLKEARAKIRELFA